ncbi:MAG: peptidase [Chloroflexaceae bacterium]|nr:peptidase [Chloroflexaceae bacterium]
MTIAGDAAAGYYRQPTVWQDMIVFVCEDDLWTVPLTGGIARRLTANPGQVSMPALSPDGRQLAYTARDEGNPEIYVMAAQGGPAQRLTYLGEDSTVVGWHPKDNRILFASNVGQPFFRNTLLYAIAPDGSEVQLLPTGPARSISYGPDGGAVIGRNTIDIAYWKRYRGGRTGDIWIDPDGQGEWHRLLQLPGNVAMPLWVGKRIFFVSDHQGVGNLYSCLPTGEDVRRHTHHADYYVRHPATDGQHIVYHAGADIYVFDPSTNTSRQVDITFYSPQTQSKRKFVEAERYLQGYALHPKGQAVATINRGQAFAMYNWEGPVMQYGQSANARYRLIDWLNDGKRLVVVSDIGDEEALEIHHADAQNTPERLDQIDIGRPLGLSVSPTKDEIILSNHRNELIWVDLANRTARTLDRSRYEHIAGFAWSPDGIWVAYGFYNTQQTSIIRLCQVATGETWDITHPVLRDMNPAFDPEGKYLYFLSSRDFNLVHDSLHFARAFLWNMRPFLITLQADTLSPFIRTPQGDEQKKGDEKKDDNNEEKDQKSEEDEEKEGDNEENDKADNDEKTKKEGQNDKKGPKTIRIDLDGIQDRVIAFPVAMGRYGQIRGIKGKALFSSYPLENRLHQNNQPSKAPAARGTIEVYTFEDHECENLIEGVTNFTVSRDGRFLIYRAANRLRVIKAGEKPKNNNPSPLRKSGWIDLSRIKVSVQPQTEWQQMYREAWRLQRDNFWTEDMSGVDWQLVYQRYLPLLQRVTARSEFSDLMWEMQGELGTSHAYEYGGDYPPFPHYQQGMLAADFAYDTESDSYRITHIVRGDVWDDETSSPLMRPGLNIKPGDRLIAINGQPVNRHVSPGQLLVNQAGNEVALTLFHQDATEPRTIFVRTLRNEVSARYREWVDANRRMVHEATDGRVGYVHVPDMGPWGYAEFHRGYLAEIVREGLVIDVRFNRGGNVSQLLLEKLARRRLGYDVQRWGEPVPYPLDSVFGPIVALTNEHAASDGDMFSHAFKLMNLGPLIGKRTWGGVIGIQINDTLVDGGFTSQPEFSMWFEDVGWRVENYGTDPTIDVDIRPQDYVAGRDPQMERAIAEIQRMLEEHPPQIPDFGERPRLSLPTLPDA